MITLEFEMNDQRQGPGIWKFNDTLLENENFCKLVSDKIQNIKTRYVYMDAFDLWELIKFEIRNTARFFAQEKSQQDGNRFQLLENTLKEMHIN